MWFFSLFHWLDLYGFHYDGYLIVTIIKITAKFVITIYSRLSPRFLDGEILADETKQKRVSFDLRGENAEDFEAWRKSLSAELGFSISPSKALLWLLNKVRREEE